MILGVIPARGGSKRIPRKNIKPFAGKPIIAYSIQAAKDTGLFDRVIVSTDDAEIAAVAAEWGASVPFMRPAELADDFTGTSAVMKHAIRWMMDAGETVDYVCCIYATAPFIDPQFLHAGYEKLRQSNKSFAFAVTSYPFPIQRAIRIRTDGAVEPINPEHIFTRSQDLEACYHDAGQFYWARPQAYLNDEPGMSTAAWPIVIPRSTVQDIDTMEDWEMAELMYQSYVKTRVEGGLTARRAPLANCSFADDSHCGESKR
jgi:N-acylneuraminate cytidylyltransferase